MADIGGEMDIRDYLKENKILTDGAFGTYYSSKYDSDELPERANILFPERVKSIHLEYLMAGASLIRTNTFAANSHNLKCGADEQLQNIDAACKLAFDAVKEYREKAAFNREIFIAGDIGPFLGTRLVYGTASEQDVAEYQSIAERMIRNGISIINFETFSRVEDVLKVVEFCKKKYEEKNLFIIVQICVNQYGYTNAGIPAAEIFKKLDENKYIDAFGINCGVGPAGMSKIISRLGITSGKYFTALPNASFPGRAESRMVFSGNEDYFADRMHEICLLGADIVGGCCGTTPEYINGMSRKLDLKACAHKVKVTDETDKIRTREAHSEFWHNSGNRKLITVELAPPFAAHDTKIMDAANYLINHNIDAITLPDSPSGRTRADSCMVGLKIERETGITTIPHICCRDRNVIAIRSYILGAYINGIRNFLIITGDPVPTMMRQNTKSVFNFDSIGLMRVLKAMNSTEFAEDPVTYGGAINYNRINQDVELDRMKKKIEAGATFFISQPVFTQEDINRLEKFRHMADDTAEGIRLICGLMPLISRRNALFIQNEMAGINVTDEIVNRYTDGMSREEGEETGIEIVKNVIRKTDSFADGYYFSIPFNRVHMLDRILPG